MLQTSKGSNSSSTSSSRSASISTATPNTIVEDEELLCGPKSELTPPAVANPLRPVSKSNTSVEDDSKPSFTYDLDVFNLCKEYLNTRNHHGLALIARQKGIPPILRFKVWPILLKSHPFVISPFIQPDSELLNESTSSRSNSSSSSSTGSNTPLLTAPGSIKDAAIIDGDANDNDNDSNSNSNDDDNDRDNNDANTKEKEEDERNNKIREKIKRDLAKYIQRLKYSQSKYTVSETEHEILSILENAIMKFTLKWGKIIKYDLSLTWIALNLAEWFPPIPKTPWVLVGKEYSNSHQSLIVNFLDDYSNYIDNIPDLREYLERLIYHDEKISTISFREVYERLVLVLLHCPQPVSRRKKSDNQGLNQRRNQSEVQKDQQSFKVNKTTLPKTGGTIEERVSYFIYCLRKLIPELSQYFHEEQILTKFGCLDDEWLIWWLKFCGTKVWSKYDRGRIWDFMLGWRLKNPKRDFNYYYEKLNYVNRNTLEKLGPDIFWSVGNEEEDISGDNNVDANANEINNTEKTETGKLVKREGDIKRSSFKDLVNELSNELHISKRVSTDEVATSTSSPATTKMASSSSTSSTLTPNVSIPFSRVDPHVALIFISLSLLKSKENILVELDQHEIRQFLSRLPSKSYKYNQKRSTRQKRTSYASNASSTSNSPMGQLPVDRDEDSIFPTSRIVISNDSKDQKHKVNFIDNIILEAGELWRKWLWLEMVEDN